MSQFLMAVVRLVAALRRGLRDPETRALLISLLMLIGLGTGFYSVVEGWSVIDSVYFCFTTLSTIGFGDLHPTQPLSKMFTIVYMLLGIGTFVALVTKLARYERKERPGTDC